VVLLARPDRTHVLLGILDHAAELVQGEHLPPPSNPLLHIKDGTWRGHLDQHGEEQRKGRSQQQDENRARDVQRTDRELVQPGDLTGFADRLREGCPHDRGAIQTERHSMQGVGLLDTGFDLEFGSTAERPARMALDNRTSLTHSSSPYSAVSRQRPRQGDPSPRTFVRSTKAPHPRGCHCRIHAQ